MNTRRSISMFVVMAMVATGFGCGLVTVAPQTAQAGGAYMFKGAGQNGAGGVTAGSRRVIRGENGNFHKNSKSVRTDGSGNVKSKRVKAFEAPNGSSGSVASGTTRTADGSLQHQSNAEYNGQNVTASSSGNITKSADGQVTATKQSSATTASGAGYTGSTSYDPATGLSKSRVCTNQYGETVPCPKQ